MGESRHAKNKGDGLLEIFFITHCFEFVVTGVFDEYSLLASDVYQRIYGGKLQCIREGLRSTIAFVLAMIFYKIDD